MNMETGDIFIDLLGNYRIIVESGEVVQMIVLGSDLPLGRYPKDSAIVVYGCRLVSSIFRNDVDFIKSLRDNKIS